jgi:putative nucleotide binding protein
LERAVEKVILLQEKKFVQFFNAAGSISLKRHQLELIPGIGKQHLEDILRERQAKPFESLKELEERIKFLSSPVVLLRRHIIEELKGEEKYYLFARPPQQEQPERVPTRRSR